MLQNSTELRDKLAENTRFFREELSKIGLEILPGEHPIVPVMFGDAHPAVKMAESLLKKGVYVIPFSFPVVSKGKARIRTQVSAAHSREDLQFAVEKFAEAKAEVGI
jgi:glycine C-acetyltransferase